MRWQSGADSVKLDMEMAYPKGSHSRAPITIIGVFETVGPHPTVLGHSIWDRLMASIVCKCSPGDSD